MGGLLGWTWSFCWCLSGLVRRIMSVSMSGMVDVPLRTHRPVSCNKLECKIESRYIRNYKEVVFATFNRVTLKSSA